MNTVQNRTIDLGNGESLSRGVFPNSDGTFTALTFAKSKTFKTEAGAIRWLIKNCGEGIHVLKKPILIKP